MGTEGEGALALQQVGGSELKTVLPTAAQVLVGAVKSRHGRPPDTDFKRFPSAFVLPQTPNAQRLRFGVSHLLSNLGRGQWWGGSLKRNSLWFPRQCSCGVKRNYISQKTTREGSGLQRRKKRHLHLGTCSFARPNTWVAGRSLGQGRKKVKGEWSLTLERSLFRYPCRNFFYHSPSVATVSIAYKFN